MNSPPTWPASAPAGHLARVGHAVRRQDPSARTGHRTGPQRRCDRRGVGHARGRPGTDHRSAHRRAGRPAPVGATFERSPATVAAGRPGLRHRQRHQRAHHALVSRRAWPRRRASSGRRTTPTPPAAGTSSPGPATRTSKRPSRRSTEGGSAQSGFRARLVGACPMPTCGRRSTRDSSAQGTLIRGPGPPLRGAVQLDSASAEGHASLATTLARVPHHWAGSEGADYRRVIEILPQLRVRPRPDRPGTRHPGTSPGDCRGREGHDAGPAFPGHPGRCDGSLRVSAQCAGLRGAGATAQRARSDVHLAPL